MKNVWLNSIAAISAVWDKNTDLSKCTAHSTEKGVCMIRCLKG